MAGDFEIDIETNSAEVADLLHEIGAKILRETQAATTNKQMSKTSQRAAQEVGLSADMVKALLST